MKIKKPIYTKRIADEIFAKIIRSAGRCYRCASPYNLQCAHIFSRTYYSIRWNKFNAVCLCAKCHIFFTYHPIEWEDYIKARIGEERYNWLRVEAQTYKKIDYKQIIEELQDQSILPIDK